MQIALISAIFGKDMKKFKYLSVVWGMVVVTIFILLTIVGFAYKKNTSIYKEWEDKIKDATTKYVDAQFLYPDSKDPLKIEASTLIEEGYLDNIVINDEECLGYGTVTYNGMVYEYKGYVKCSNYTTKDY